MIGKPAIPGLLQSLKEPQKQTRIGAIGALARIGGSIAIESLLITLTDSESEIRAISAMALESIADAKSIPGLIQALRDTDIDVHRAAASALKSIGAPSVPALLTALRDDKPQLRQAATWALGEIGEPARLGLIQALDDENALVRLAARIALGEMEHALIPRLLESLKDKDESIRITAIHLLGEYGQIPEDTHEAVSAIVAILGDGEWALRSVAADALDSIGAPAVMILINTLGNQSEQTVQRIYAALGLSILRDASSLPVLIKIAQNQNEHWMLRQKVAWALEAIGGSQAKAILKQLKSELPFIGFSSPDDDESQDTSE